MNEITKKLIEDNWDNLMIYLADFYEQKFPSFKYLIGQVMKESKGKANPIIVRRLLAEKLLKYEN